MEVAFSVYLGWLSIDPCSLTPAGSSSIILTPPFPLFHTLRDCRGDPYPPFSSSAVIWFLVYRLPPHKPLALN